MVTSALKSRFACFNQQLIGDSEGTSYVVKIPFLENPKVVQIPNQTNSPFNL